MTRRLLVACLALVLVAVAGCGGRAAEPPGVAEQVQADAALAALSRDLDGGVPAGRADVRDLVAAVVASVQDMSRLDAAAYESTHGRPADQQAQLVGRWLAGAASALRGRVAAVELAEAAQAALPAAEPARTLLAEEVVERFALQLSALAPDEPTDNPGLPGAENLRSTLQTAYASG